MVLTLRSVLLIQCDDEAELVTPRPERIGRHALRFTLYLVVCFQCIVVINRFCTFPSKYAAGHTPPLFAKLFLQHGQCIIHGQFLFHFGPLLLAATNRFMAWEMLVLLPGGWQFSLLY